MKSSSPILIPQLWTNFRAAQQFSDLERYLFGGSQDDGWHQEGVVVGDGLPEGLASRTVDVNTLQQGRAVCEGGWGDIKPVGGI